MMPVLHKFEAVAAEEDFALAEALFSRHVSAGWEEESLPGGGARLIAHCPEKSVLSALAGDLRRFVPAVLLTFSELPEQDWTTAWRDFFTPVPAGIFLILPPWLAGTPPAGLIPLLVEPKSAFGTGHHPSTTLCLEAVSRLYGAGLLRPGRRFLDLGSGTGILGMACARLGLSGLCLDTDPLAVSNALENRALNGLDEALDIRSGSVQDAGGDPFDLILSNILAEPLREMAPPIMRLLRPDACLVLSGFLTRQVHSVEQAYAALGPPLRLTAPSCAGDDDAWACLAWPKGAALAQAFSGEKSTGQVQRNVGSKGFIK